MSHKYPNCAHIKRPPVELAVNEEIATAIGREFRVLPLFEKNLYEYTYTKYYSLNNNEFLKCRWLEYKRNYDDHVIAPFKFIDIRDYHFYNCRNRLLPAQNFHTRPSYRMHLKPGPGVDLHGQMPIPQEALMKRSQGPKVMPKRYPTKEVTENEEV